MRTNFNALSRYSPFLLGLYDSGTDITITNSTHTLSIAGYAQGTLQVADQTHLTVGLRETTEHREAHDGDTSVYVIPIAATLPVINASNQHVTFDKLTFRLSLDHRFSEEALGYLSFNRGFKSGGFNTGSPGTPPYEPETIDAYELGTKTDFLNRRFRLNMAAYYYDYKNIQSQFLETGVIEIKNAAAAHIYGLDLDFQALVTDQLRFTGGLNAQHANYISYPNALFSTSIGGTPTVVGSAAGNQLPLASKRTLNIGVDYTHPTAVGSFDFVANVYFNDGFYAESDNVIRQPSFLEPGASIRWTDSSEHLWISLFGRNLNDRRVLSFSTTAANGTHFVEYAEPRIYGVSVGYKY